MKTGKQVAAAAAAAAAAAVAAAAGGTEKCTLFWRLALMEKRGRVEFLIRSCHRVQRRRLIWAGGGAAALAAIAEVAEKLVAGVMVVAARVWY